MKQTFDFRPLPNRQLSYLKNLTTRIGLIQHAKGSQPDLAHGYSLDDNARALIAIQSLVHQFPTQISDSFITPYFNFIKRAQNPDGWFVNFFDHLGNAKEERGSVDSVARTIWALSLLSTSRNRELSASGRLILERSTKHVGAMTNLNALAYSLLGATARGDRQQAQTLIRKILYRFEKNAGDGWEWFQDSLTHANAVVPLGLAQASRAFGSNRAQAVAISSFEFLNHVCRIGGVPAPIGNKGWYPRGGHKALYDQQPIDAADMALAAAALHQATNDQQYQDRAIEWWLWFHGHNVKKVTMVDKVSGGIYDGINKDGVNKNQGAENIALYLITYCALRAITLEG